MKKNKKPIEMRLWAIEELGQQVEVIGLLLRFFNSEIPLSEENFTGIGSILEVAGQRIQKLKRSVFKDLSEDEIKKVILAQERTWL